MKKLKLLFLSILIFLITGCSADYEINITDDEVKEKILLTVPNELEKEKKDKFLEYTKVDTVAILGGYENPYYKMKEINGSYENKYEYSYTYDKDHPIKSARTLKSCFDHYKIEETDSYYMFMFVGKYKCAYDLENVNITLKTNNEVSKHNSTDYDTSKGIYKWKLNKNNYNDAEIKFIVLKNSYPEQLKDKSTGLVKNIALTIFLLFIIIGGGYFAKKLIKIVDRIEK